MSFTKDEIRKAMVLYAITDRGWLKEGQTLQAVCREVLEQGATFLQIREKDLPADTFAEEAAALMALCQRYHVPYVVNDNVEIALAIGADGVHVGQSDIKGRDIRSIIGPEKILGISAGTLEEALGAERAGADYIGVGAVFGTSTKKNARNLTVKQLREICREVSIPVVAIGGINARNLQELSGSGVDGVAVISAIFGAEDPGRATGELLTMARELVAHG